jgi:hypothetical protein
MRLTFPSVEFGFGVDMEDATGRVPKVLAKFIPYLAKYSSSSRSSATPQGEC